MAWYTKIILPIAISALKAELPRLKAKAEQTKTPFDDELWRAVDIILIGYDTGKLFPGSGSGP